VKIHKAVITAAAPGQRTLALQSLVDRDGVRKSVLSILVEECFLAGIEAVCVIVHPGDEAAYREASGDHKDKVTFIPQENPRGYGHALYLAREFVAGEPFLHLVGDHIFISTHVSGHFARHLVEVAEEHSCSVSGVQSTRENLLPLFGTVGGQRIKGTQDLYVVERVTEKPTPTEAEQSLLIPGLRAGHYLCFIGTHILSPTVMELLETHLRHAVNGEPIQLSPVLDELAQRERYLAVEAQGRRYPLDTRYGLLTSQLALGLSGVDRDEVLTSVCELLAQRELGAADR